VYYRCHSRDCKQVSVREEDIDSSVERFFEPMQLSGRERSYLENKLSLLKREWTVESDNDLRSLELRRNQTKDRLERLTDAVIEKVIDKAEFEQRKATLLMELSSIEDSKAQLASSTATLGHRVSEFFELAESLYLGYKLGICGEKRDFIKMATSNRTVSGKNVVVEPRFPFNLIKNGSTVLDSAPSRARLRTLDEMLAKVVGYFESNPGEWFRLSGSEELLKPKTNYTGFAAKYRPIDGEGRTKS